MYHLVTDKNKISIQADKEIILSKNEIAVSRTDINGNILYYNHTFAKISGYKNSELLYAPHSILRHPNMPKAIFYIIWQTLLSGRSTHAIIKNFTKDGKYYWLLIEFIVQKDNQNSIVSFLSRGKQAPKRAIKIIEPIYKDLLKIERDNNMENSIKYLSYFLNKNNYATYNDYICRISKKEKKSFLSNLRF
ncbi:MAG TPA: PAS domain S-box protein [Campylobacterales bacterium]|nr:PAS domain S-box protein [Campylobacterales bacterium]